ncbi:hypothetical protein Misp01_01250 [Microtetraspora sp. NBRC 13810]|nr:hypothetical protein Misp01_01250 [Microtetraspora sp. NBRC 13810]
MAPFAALCLLTVLVHVTLQLSGQDAGARFGTLAGCAALVVAVWVTVWVTVWVAVWGGGVRSTARRHLEGLAERERDQRARIGAAAERAKIARELHDVIAHDVSVIIVQADGAGYALDSDPEQARRAVQAISATGRQALAEMRRLVAVLRPDAAEPAGEDYAPQPGLAELERLTARTAGPPVEWRITGSPDGLTDGEQLAVYRIVQEALANVAKHGGPAARATVELAYGPREVALRVTDDGRGATARDGRDGEEPGRGLVGVRERVAMYGGGMRAGPRAEGGFEVAVRLPVSRRPRPGGGDGPAGCSG